MSNVCEQCRENASKYKCPGCGARSCGLACVKAHKEASGCTGKRDPAEFVSMAEFDDNRLVSDYNFLEEVLRASDVAKRRLRMTSGKLKNELKDLLVQCKVRRTRFRFMAGGMSKQIANTSYFNRKRKSIFWRVEWLFDSTEISFIDEKVDEHVKLGKVLEKHLSPQSHSPTVRHKLREFLSLPMDQLKLLLKQDDKQCFYSLNTEEPLRDQLAFKTVLEFPVIRVVLPSELHRFTILEDPRPPKTEPSKPTTADEEEEEEEAEETIEGKTFREEELNEDQEDMGMFELLEDLPGNAALLWKSLEMQPPTLMGYDGLEDGEIPD